jgi:hypothetical protein
MKRVNCALPGIDAYEHTQFMLRHRLEYLAIASNHPLYKSPMKSVNNKPRGLDWVRSVCRVILGYDIYSSPGQE